MNKVYAVPVSVKCIVFEDNKVWLRKNERGEWELPGGKLDPGEQPQQTAAREALEELGIEVSVAEIVGATLYTVPVSKDETRGVFVIAYMCDFLERTGKLEVYGEAGEAEFAAFHPKDIANLPMPAFYKEWIASAAQ